MAVKNFACVCDSSGVGSLELPACVKKAGLLKRDFFMNKYANDNTRNGVLATDFVDGVLPSAFILARLIDPDLSKRWTPTPDQYEEADPSRTDRTTQESSTGTIKILRNGQMVRSFQLWDVPHNWSAKLNKVKCIEMATISVDESGALVGEVNNDGSEFYGLSIQKNTLNAESFEANGGTDAYTLVTYQISRSVQEGCYLTIGADSTEEDMLEVKSLIEVDLTQGVGPNTNTEIFVDAQNITIGEFNGGSGYQKLTGAILITDWKVYTSAGTAGTEIVVVSVEEITPGYYKITLTADAATDVYLSYVKQKTSAVGFGYFADQALIVKP